MIDTDKYEGHLAHLDYELWAFTDFMNINATHEERCATDALLNDAPLLLAEVKRLRDIINHEIVLPRSKQFFMQHYGEDDFEEVWKKWADGIQKKYWMEK
tara:strand:- start:90 stop:389 length:300 start_codon:yes stop_codon:yes gene_type:complete